MKNLCSIFLLLFLFTNNCLPQADSIFHIDQLSPDGILLDRGWKFQLGDDPAYANAYHDDKGWKTINPATDGGGVSKFDRARLNNYNTGNGLVNDFVNDAVQDKHGNLVWNHVVYRNSMGHIFQL